MSYIAGTTMRGARNFLVVFAIILVSPSFETSLALAQGTTAITPTIGIGNLGTKVTTDGQTVQITGGTRPGNGTNLFHSFDQFIVGPGDAAHFLNTTPSLRTENILSRVTGGNPSSIFGTIDTMSYPEANLFLMNPAGVVFGPSATLHVGGSVAFTTANYLRLAGADGSGSGIFHADTTTTSLLTSASVSTFGFLSPNPAAIAVQGSRLIVQPGQSISLVGGNITVQSSTLANDTSQSARLSAPGGQIKIASVASPGEVLAENFGQAPNTHGQSLGTLGTVRISKQSHIDTSGEGGGAILVRGGHLIVDDSTISANSTKAAKSGAGRRLDPSWLGIGIEVDVAQDAIIDNGAIIETKVEQGALLGSGGVRITADRIMISGGPKILKFVETHPTAEFPFAGVKSNVTSKSTAASSGGISLNATSIDIKSLGQIETTTTSAGHAGHISLQASGDIVLDSGFIRSASATSSGNAGNIVLASSTGDVRLAPGLLASQTDNSSGNAGNITLRASQGHVSVATSSFVTSQANNSAGNAGSITIEAPHGDVMLEGTTVLNSINKDTGTLGGIQVTANNLFLTGSHILENNVAKQAAGNIVIMLEGRLNLTGDSFIQTGTDGPANAAHLIIRARDILITENSSLLTEPTAASVGAAGAIDLSAQTLTIQNGGKISATTFGISPTATGGSITIKVTDQVMMSDNASITASSRGPADAGSISINAGRQLELHNASSITTTTILGQANGGDIGIQATDRVRLVNNSEISTSVKGTEGSGGNIFIDPKVVILESSNVTANAVTGAGGNITFVTPLFLADSASRISASSERGPSGTVTIQSPTANLSGVVGQLVSKASPPQVLLQNRCIALAGSEQSTFILAGRDTLPIEPGGWLRSPVSMEHWTGEDTEHASGLIVRRNRPNGLPRMIRPMDKTQVLSLRGLTPSGFLVQAFAGDSPTGCRS
jgi:filamentous hemagglutinin family protein